MWPFRKSSAAAALPPDPFQVALRGQFSSLLSWAQLDEFWITVQARAGQGWYVYCLGEPVPTTTLDAEQVRHFVQAVDALLRKDHDEDYCGIVYADSKTDPAFIKIFDPNNLGVSCGSSEHPPLPGWIMSRLPPCHLENNRPLPESRRRWWRALWQPVQAASAGK
jgi:hypothetical protein